MAGLLVGRHGELDRPRVADEPRHLQLGQRQRTWAGQVINRNGKFYWYVPVTNRSTGRMAIGVGVSTSPTGPFTDAIGRPLVENGEIDPTVFIDDNGQAYLYWGNPNLWYVRLNTDMISYSGSATQIALTTSGFGTRSGNTSRPTLYEEGPWVYKRNGLYYNVFAAKCCSSSSATRPALSATGPWTYRGTVMPTQGGSFTNHAGIIDFNGGSYFFYHNGALPGGGGYTRSVAVEKFSYNSDGTHPDHQHEQQWSAPGRHAEPVRSSGGRDHRPGARALRPEPSSEGGMNVGWIENNDSIKVEGAALRWRRDHVHRSVASATSGGRIELHLDSVAARSSAPARSAARADGGTWTTVTCPVSGAHRHPRPVPEIHRRQRKPVQHQLVAVHRQQRGQREPADERDHRERHDRMVHVRQQRRAGREHGRRARGQPVPAGDRAYRGVEWRRSGCRRRNSSTAGRTRPTSGFARRVAHPAPRRCWP